MKAPPTNHRPLAASESERDDRGRSLAALRKGVPPDEQERPSPTRWQHPVGRVVIALLGLAGIVTWIVLSGQTLASVVTPLIGILVFRFVTRDLRRAKFSAALVAHDRCGSCRSPLDTLAPDPDGLLTCPKCGAAWYADRVVFPGHGEDYIRDFATLHRLSPPAAADDRGLWTDFYALWPPPHGAVTPETRSAMRREVKRIALRCLARAAIAFTALMTAFALAALLRTTPDTEAPDDSWLLPVIVGGLISLVIGVVYKDPRIAMRETMLRHGLCPNCCTQIQDVAPARDGRICCPRCKRAWDTERVGTPTPVHTPA